MSNVNCPHRKGGRGTERLRWLTALSAESSLSGQQAGSRPFAVSAAFGWGRVPPPPAMLTALLTNTTHLGSLTWPLFAFPLPHSSCSILFGFSSCWGCTNLFGLKMASIFLNPVFSIPWECALCGGCRDCLCLASCWLKRGPAYSRALSQFRHLVQLLIPFWNTSVKQEMMNSHSITYNLSWLNYLTSLRVNIHFL